MIQKRKTKTKEKKMKENKTNKTDVQIGLALAGKILQETGNALSEKEETNSEQKESVFPFTLHHRWWPSKLVEGLNVMDQQFSLRIDMGDKIVQLDSNFPIDQSENKVFLSENIDRTWLDKGSTVEKIITPLHTDVTKLDTSWLSLLDSGEATLLEQTDDTLKIALKSGKFDKTLVFNRGEDTYGLWFLDESN